MNRRLYPLAGLFATAFGTLLLEIALTRVFSVAMWYHYAFMAISLALFGLTVGGLYVHAYPASFDPDRLGRTLGNVSLLLGPALPVAFLTVLSVPFVPRPSFIGIYSTVFIYAVLAVPFVLSGIVIAAMITRNLERVGAVYAVDLAGSAAGCLGAVGLMRLLPAPSVVILAAAIFTAAGAAFHAAAGNGRGIRRGIGLTAALIGLCLINLRTGWVKIEWAKSQLPGVTAAVIEVQPEYERWNPFSRISVYPMGTEPFGWGFSPAFAGGHDIRQKFLVIDATAGTVITGFDGSVGPEEEHLKYDISALAHHLRRNADVLVIGTGGGRDVLTALTFGQRSVTGVEINAEIIETVNTVYGAFSGRLDLQPGVAFENDEARSWIESSGRRFDIIQASMIDSWAATSAGAFTLTENSLYTVEGWSAFLDRLTGRGVLTFSRWNTRDGQAELLRLTGLAAAALRRAGVAEPRDHVMLAATEGNPNPGLPAGVGTILVGRRPFSDEDVAAFLDLCRQMRYRVLLSPRATGDGPFDRMLMLDPLFLAAAPLDLSPPTDDRPFFFHMLRPGGELPAGTFSDSQAFNQRAVVVLETLLATVIVLSLLAIVLPGRLIARRYGPGGRAAAGGVYFSAIGLAFMLMEIGLMQRLNLLLGHPVYGLSVVLFSLLVGTGLGSLLSSRVSSGRREAGTLVLMAMALVAVMYASGPLLELIRGQSIGWRLLAAAGLMITAGLAAGRFFPAGMRLFDPAGAGPAAWFWALNGAFSVTGSVAAVFLSLAAGIRLTLLAAAVVYAIAIAAFALRALRSGP